MIRRKKNIKYSQYSEEDLQKAVEEVKNNLITPRNAEIKYQVPRNTIMYRINHPDIKRRVKIKGEKY